MTKKSSKKRKIGAPHVYTIIMMLVIIAYALAWILPSGQFDRIYDEATESELVVAGSYHAVEKDYPDIFDLFTAIQRGYVEIADITFFIFFAYGFMYLLTKNGTLNALIGLLLRKLGNRISLLIPVSMLAFGLLGSVAGLYEEIYGLVPVFIGIALAIGYDEIVGGAIVITGVGIGFSAAIINPFSLGIAQEIAGVSLYTGTVFRIVTFLLFMIVGVFYVMRYARKVRKDPSKSIMHGEPNRRTAAMSKEELADTKFTGVHLASSIIFVITIALVLYSTLNWGWYINELGGLFLLALIITGFVSKMKFGAIMDVWIESIKEIAFGLMTIGFVRGAIVLLEDSMVMDTVINFFAELLSNSGLYFTAIGMFVVQYLADFFITGGPAQAVATMPIMAPLSDLVGMNREIAVQAYVFASGFADMIWPTAVAIDCAIMAVPLQKWYRFILPLVGVFLVMQVALMIVCVNIYA